MQNDHRTARRKFMSAPAVICKDTGAVISACAVLDVSETGMRIRLAKAAALTGKITVVLSKDGAVRRKGRVVWQTGRSAGIQFDRRYSSRAAAPARGAREIAWV
jgi:PilZ domain